MRGMRSLTDDEIEQVKRCFLGAFAARDYALFILGIKSGFRISEILSLKLGDVFDNGKIQDRVYVRRKHMKGRNEGRCVVLHPAAKTSIQSWIDQLIANGATSDTYIFKSRNGTNKPITRVQAWKMLTRIYGAAGLSGSLGTHSLRKTFADRIYDKLGHDLLKTQRALGHRDIKSTISYLAFKQEDIDDAILSI
jgi:integrase